MYENKMTLAAWEGNKTLKNCSMLIFRTVFYKAIVYIKMLLYCISTKVSICFKLFIYEKINEITKKLTLEFNFDYYFTLIIKTFNLTFSCQKA